MKRFVMSMLLVLAVVLLHGGVSRADCGFELIVKNTGTADVTVTKISTSTSPPIYKKQWDGSQVLAPGISHTFSFSVDTCPSSKSRKTKVFFTKGTGTIVYQDVETHVTGEVQELP